MNEREWIKETENPSGYLKSLGAAMQLGYPGETNSHIKPYNHKEHAWSHENADYMH